MKNQQEEPTLLFQKFLEGKCNAMELQFLLAYFQADQIDDKLTALVAKEIQSNEVEDQLMQPKVDQIIQVTDLAMIALTSGAVKDTKISKINFLNWKWAAGIAAAIVVLSLGILNFQQIFPGNEQLMLAQVPNKKISTIYLADGSKITLNAGSKFSYPKQFSGKTREVYLEGEAMFEVARDVKKPFIVHAGNLRTTVLGTSFNIKAYKGDERIQVTVVSGKVNVIETSTGRNVNLVRDEWVVFNAKTDEFDLQKIASARNTVKWKIGRLAFEDARFEEVVQEFSRKYGQQVLLENASIGNCRISIVFNQEQPDEILKILAILANASYRKQGDKIIFYGAGCPEEHTQTKIN